MSTTARRVTEELQAFADLPVTDHDVEQALAAVHDRILEEEPRRRPRSWVTVAAAVLVVIAVAIGAGLALRSRTTVPADDPALVDSTLVVEYWSHPLWGHNGMVWVYADGRVITSVREDAPPYPISYVERRLTRGGLDALLDRVASLSEGVTTDHLRHPCVSYQPCRQSVVSVIRVNGVHYDVVDNHAVADLLFDMESQLPDSAWHQQEAEPYVPATYLACYGYPDSVSLAIEKAAVVDRLPPLSRDVIAAKPATRVAQPLGLHPGNLLCSRLTPPEARRVTRALGLPLVSDGEFYEFRSVTGQPAFMYVTVTLPHGISGLYGG